MDEGARRRKGSRADDRRVFFIRQTIARVDFSAEVLVRLQCSRRECVLALAPAFALYALVQVNYAVNELCTLFQSSK